MGNGGNLNITTRSLEVTNGARLVANTRSQGDAGRIFVQATDFVSLARSRILNSVEAGAVGQGGNTNITTGLLTLNRAVISSDSRGTGKAGNITLNARSVGLNRSRLVAETASQRGGNITLRLEDLLLLRRGSRISTTAGTDRTGGNGGNITINSLFIVAIPKENSDIRANAFIGNGGRVEITTQGIFGIQFRPKDTPESDITASSEFGVNGTVQINTPDVDLSRGLTSLPSDVVDASNQIAQNCPASGGKIAQNEFIITGRGGLPDNPNEMLSTDAVWTDLRNSGAVSRIQGEEPVAARAVSRQPPTANRQPPFVEANGWVINDKGQVILTATAPTVTPHSPALMPAACPLS